MRIVGLMAAATLMAATGCDGCDHGTIYHPDFSGEDLAVPLDLGGDLRIPGDLSAADAIPDLRLAQDAQRIVNYAMYIDNLATAVCTNLMNCGGLDNGQFQVCKDAVKASAAGPFD